MRNRKPTEKERRQFQRLLPQLVNGARWVVETKRRAAVSSEWSNGQTEGQVNRLKMLKRQMYGRANFDLLRAQVLNHL